MNITQANNVIAGLNRVAELVTSLAADVESAAWKGIEDHAGMPGARPIAAAQLAQPSLEAAAAEHNQAQAEDSAQVKTPDLALSLADVRAVLSDLSSQGLTKQVRQLIVDAGADRLSDVDPANYGWLLTRAKGLADA
nr:hypothetical protein CYJ21_00725 [Actinomyces sp. UMB0138]